MKSFLTSILCFLILLNANSCHCDCVTAELTSPRYYASSYNFTQGPLIWTANSKTLATCYQEDSCFSAPGISGNGLFIQIDNVTIASYQNVKLKYEIENSPTIVCQAMEIYAEPRNVTCKTEIKGDYLYFTCLATQVSTHIWCPFRETYFPLLKMENITYQRLNIQPGSIYFDNECTSSYRLSSIPPGNYTLETDIFCNVSTSSRMCWYGATSATELTLPEVDILGLCPNGTDVVGNFVLAGSPATCTCFFTSSGYPPGYLKFESPTNGPLDVTTSDDKAILHLIYDNTSQSHDYICSGHSALQPPYNVKPFRVEFAFGPSSVSIVTEPKTDTVNLCPGSTSALNVMCVVPRDSTYPVPYIYLHINNTNVSSSSSYQLEFEHKFNKGGINELRCYAENSKFKKLNTDSVIIITVQEPPKIAPVLNVNDTLQYTGLTGNTVNVSTDDTANVTCEGHGGFPPVDLTNITCNDSTVPVEMGGHVKVRLSKDGQVVICNCTAYHASGCYSNNTSSLRFLAFAPDGVTKGKVFESIYCETTDSDDDIETTSNTAITESDDDIETLSKKARVARPDCKERVFVEQIGSETRITLEIHTGRLRFFRSKITKCSKNVPQAKSQASAANLEVEAGMHRKRSGSKKRLKQKTRTGDYVNTQ